MKKIPPSYTVSKNLTTFAFVNKRKFTIIAHPLCDGHSTSTSSCKVSEEQGSSFKFPEGSFTHIYLN